MGDNFNPNNQMGGHPQQQQQQSQQQQQQQPQQQPQHPNMPMPQINRSIANNIGLYIRNDWDLLQKNSVFKFWTKVKNLNFLDSVP